MFRAKKNNVEGGDQGDVLVTTEARLISNADKSKPSVRGRALSLAGLAALGTLLAAAPQEARAQDAGEIARASREVGRVIEDRRRYRTETVRERGGLSAEIQAIDRRLIVLVGTDSRERMPLPDPRTITISAEDPSASLAERSAARYRDEVARAREAFRLQRITATERDREITDAGVSFRSEMAGILRERDQLIVDRATAVSRLGTDQERRIEDVASTIGNIASVVDALQRR